MSPTMKKIGLALSGGGFRASLYHLGLVRFLRDAGILSQVSHITSVSGGSILAAHLVLNWGRYNGSANEFDAAASEFLAFVRLDVRNRIIRRFPLTLPLRWPRRLLGRSNRKLSRTGLLEYHYEKFLYGDKSLFELPEKPQLHILATNLSEGCLCSFNRDGLLMMRRQPGSTFRMDRIHVGLATVAMAVTASSAFPGFFPPLELTGADVGAVQGEFGRQAYTDGGVFDNLGVRMFRCLEDDGGPKTTLVSDVGKPIEVQDQRRPGGLIRTAMRATDILMDRVWQLESRRRFADTPGFVFAPITEVVEPADGSDGPAPGNSAADWATSAPTSTASRRWKSAAWCGTATACARKACRCAPDLFGEPTCRADAPWDPVPGPTRSGPRLARCPRACSARFRAERIETSATPGPGHAECAGAASLGPPAHLEHRMLDYRDWVSYLYVPILVPILSCCPTSRSRPTSGPTGQPARRVAFPGQPGTWTA